MLRSYHEYLLGADNSELGSGNCFLVIIFSDEDILKNSNYLYPEERVWISHALNSWTFICLLSDVCNLNSS
jgi:hypothetical protein